MDEETKEREKTSYVVLEQGADKDSGHWAQIGPERVPALSAEGAIRAVCAKRGITGGTYIAVPARSWKPVTVKTETKTVLTLT